ncbi:Proteinase_inhibitor I25 [Hexamita inflata]|uniref:Conserved site n=1 Tax=Hexamita inflata TaxID=28002 RepID=A0AA86QNU7_9EUKA|nr:Proteinase inhibitor I25 [Hexamita inflata]CAI9963121.1 Proteinase inhibitor I25 [Hexamita inflata]
MMCGGITAQPTTELNPDVLTGLTQQLELQKKKLVKVLQVSTQVVAGFLYHLQLQLVDGNVTLKLWWKVDRSFEITEMKYI